MNAKREVNDLAKSVAIQRNYKVSVQDMINSAKKVNDDFGLDSYEDPYIKFNPHVKKALNYSVSKDQKPRDRISILMQQKKKVPGPTDYKTNPVFGAGGKFHISKGAIPSYFEGVVN